MCGGSWIVGMAFLQGDWLLICFIYLISEAIFTECDLVDFQGIPRETVTVGPTQGQPWPGTDRGVGTRAVQGLLNILVNDIYSRVCRVGKPWHSRRVCSGELTVIYRTQTWTRVEMLKWSHLFMQHTPLWLPFLFSCLFWCFINCG